MDNPCGYASSPESFDARIARVAALQHGVFDRADAVRCGATSRVIQRRREEGRWEQLYPGVYRIAGVPSSWHQKLFAACLVSGRGALASFRAGGALWRLSNCSPGTIEVTIPRGRRVRREGIVTHQARSLHGSDASRCDGICVTSPTRTLIDLAAVFRPEILEEALDDALRRGLTSPARLRWRLGGFDGRGLRGVGTLRTLLAMRSPRKPVPESELETRLLRLLREAGLPTPELQYRIQEGTKTVARTDFAYPESKVALEADGYRWHSSRRRWESDLARRNRLTSLGWHVIHVTAVDLASRREEIVGLVVAALERRGPS